MKAGDEMSQSESRVRGAENVQKIEGMFMCPVCGAYMYVDGTKSLVCSNRHTFDFSKQGYLNLLPRPIHTEYDRTLFKSRRKIMAETGFFEPVIQEIAAMICRKTEGVDDKFTILDMGCGEGSHLSGLCRMLQNDRSVIGVGADISKAGIELAAKSYHDQIWLVSDLVRPPFQSGLFKVILNILSPSNYEVFDSLLSENGFVVKIIPGEAYLQELRTFFYRDGRQRSYSNSQTVELFRQQYPFCTSKKIRYVRTLDRQTMRALVAMTPLTWHAENQLREEWIAKGPMEITVDMDMLVGCKRR